jgi:chromate reductase, NAD(P)H dehydrogenase (quinone)
MRKKIFAISGSTKKKSSSNAIIAEIKKRFADILEVELFEGIDTLPHFNPDEDQENFYPSVDLFRRKIELADGVIFCSPEYVYSLPGSLKNAIEWCVSTTVFSNKPVAIIIAAANGVKALESLQLIMTTIEARINSGASLLIQGAKGKVNLEGVINPEVIDQLTNVVNAFIVCIEEEDGVPTKFSKPN